jgi:hypothetical protein
MNAARIGVGIQGLSQGDIAYQNGLAYARDRKQGRSLTGAKVPEEKADPIIVHPDVRRMLMEGKAITEGLRALILWGAVQADLAHGEPSEEARQEADDLISLLTPVIKGYGTDKGYEIATNMQQVYGGHGYVEEWGMSQYVRDARIAMIYEGTNGIQALDLVGRKLASNGGRGITLFFKIVTQEIMAAKEIPALLDYATALESALGEMQGATMWLMTNAMANPDHAGAGATAYMHITGIVALGLMWLRMATAALDSAIEDKAFRNAKLITARFFAESIMPETVALRRKIEAGAGAMMAMPVNDF